MPFFNTELLNEYKEAVDLSTIVSKSDKYGNITYVNEEFCKISKYSAKELLGKPHNMLRHPDMPKEAFKYLWDTIRSGNIWKGVVKNKAKDGSSYWVKTFIKPIFDQKGNLVEYISLRTEITEIILLKEKVEKLLESSIKFVPLDFIKLLNVEDITKLRIGESVKMEMTILFSDLRNFTSYSEKKESDEVLKDLNEYFSSLVPSIISEGGFVDKYIGDAIMAIFYKPIQAVSAAKKMLENLNKFNFNRLESGKEKFDFGIGIHSGVVTLGTVGNEYRFDTTIIGDSVNFASRLESATKKLGHKILISEDVINQIPAGQFNFEQLGKIKVKGKENSITVFSLVG